jgi:hypothetical protein
VVYGDTRGADGFERQGHVGVIVAVENGVPLRVVHCSHGNDNLYGHAICETGPEKFRARGIVARYIEDEGAA